jgi:Glycoside-hydrolase family GH114
MVRRLMWIIGLSVVMVAVVAGTLAVFGSSKGSNADAASYPLPPSHASWFWELGPSQPGLAGLPPTSAAYPAPGSANIWDTDLFQDSNTANAGIPTGASPVVNAIHSAGHYSICYVNAGAYQKGFPDDANFAAADYGNGVKQYQMQGYSSEFWLDIRGFAGYQAGNSATLTGAAPNIAAGLSKRFSWCELEGQDAVEADNLDGYSGTSASGAAGAGWGLTRAEAAGFERWIAYTVHTDGMAWFLKNDTANASADLSLADGVISEQCNAQDDPCAGAGGDWSGFLAAHKPVLDAEYVEDGETTASFCPADNQAGIWGALFNESLDDTTYQPCWTS